MNARVGTVRVGELRPSQLLWAFGPGALVDLPQVSVVVMGLDFWNPDHAVPLGEARLLRAVQRALGSQVERLLALPVRPDSGGRFDPFSADASIGVPVSPFPRWLRCPICGKMGEYDSGLFGLKPDLFRPDRVRYEHTNCEKARRPPTAVPARFLVACRDGHLDDFPWRWFVHRGSSECNAQLRFYERGASLQTENLWVECTGDCGAKPRSMAEAFGERGKKDFPACRARHPHLAKHDDSCGEAIRPVLLGASNTWFPISMSVLSIPTSADELTQLVDDKWGLLKGIPSREVLPHVIDPLANAGQLPGIKKYGFDEIWTAIEAKEAASKGESIEGETDLKMPEWKVFSNPDPKSDYPDFLVRAVDPPKEYGGFISAVVLAERLREVNALIGFTRVEPPGEGTEGMEAPARAPLSKSDPSWLPATEVRGEGIFIRFQSSRLADWLKQPGVKGRAEQLLAGHKAFRAARRLTPVDANFPGVLHIMLHTFAHMLLRELSLECGYNAASIRERIYASGHGETPEIAGILLYTAAPDSDGTLGGLVELGKPENLGRLIKQALNRARICSADPLCAEHVPLEGASLHGAACHACTFAPETSCEMGNRYLDRTLVVPTMQQSTLAFFE